MNTSAGKSISLNRPTRNRQTQTKLVIRATSLNMRYRQANGTNERINESGPTRVLRVTQGKINAQEWKY